MPGPVHPAHRAQPNTPARDIDDGAETPRNKPANRNPQTPPFHRDGSPPTPDRAREKPPQRRPNRRLNPQKAHRRASSRLGGFRTDITEEQLRGAPTFYRDRDYDWSDRDRERELHDYWKTRYYWDI